MTEAAIDAHFAAVEIKIAVPRLNEIVTAS